MNDIVKAREAVLAIGPNTAKMAAEAQEELVFVREDLNERDLVERLTAAIDTGMAQGKAGNIELETLATRPLQRVLERAREITCRSETSQRLQRTARILVHLRRAQQGGRWSLDDLAAKERKYRGGSVSLPADAESSAVASHLHRGLNRMREAQTSREGAARAREARMRKAAHSAWAAEGNDGAEGGTHAAEDGGEGGDGGERKGSTAGDTGGDGSAEGGVGGDGEILDAGEDYSSDNKNECVENVLQEGLNPFILETESLAMPLCIHELTLARLELENRLITKELHAALMVGAASGVVGDLDVSTIDLQALDDAIEDATTVGCTTTEAHNLLETAILVRNIRGALSGGAWAKLRNELARSLTVAVVEISKVEIRVARDEAAHQELLALLEKAVVVGGPAGELSHLDTTVVDSEMFASILERGAQLHEAASQPETKRLLHAADMLRRMRWAVFKGEWGAAQDIAEMALGDHELNESRERFSYLGLALNEIVLIMDEGNDRLMSKALTQALQSGAAQTRGGEALALNTEEVKVEALRDAIALAEDKGAKTRKTIQLLETARCIKSLREAILLSDWDAVQAALTDAQMCDVSAIVREELELAQEVLNNQATITQLTLALQSGAATGEVGEMVMSSISVSELDVAIAGARRRGTRSTEATMLLWSATLIRRLRVALVARDWDQAADVIKEARAHDRGHKQGTTAAAAREGLDNDAAKEAAAQEGGDGEGYTETKEAQGIAGVAGEKDGEGSIIPPFGLAPVSLDEFERAEDEIANQQLVLDLTAALSHAITNGMNAGTNKDGASDMEAMRRRTTSMANLDKTIARGRRLRTKSVHMAQLLNSADMVRRMTVSQNEEDGNMAPGLRPGFGQLTGLGGGGAVQTDVKALDWSIKDTLNHLRRSGEVEQLLVSAQLIRALRMAREEENWKEVSAVLRQCRTQDIATIAQGEVDAAQAELDDHNICHALTRALSSGQVRGEPGNLDVADLSVGELDRSLGLAAELGTSTRRSIRLRRTAEIVHQLRVKLSVKDWSGIASVLEGAASDPLHAIQDDTDGTGSNTFSKLDECAHVELRLLGAEAKDRAIRGALRRALEHGRAMPFERKGDTSSDGDDGDVDPYDLRFRLDKRKGTTYAGPGAEAAVFFPFDEGKGGKGGKGDAASGGGSATAGEDASTTGGGGASVPEATEEERQQIRKKTEAGGAYTYARKGVMPIHAVEIRKLMVAINFAKVQGCETDASKRLLATAQVVVQMRRGVSNVDWPAVWETLTAEQENIRQRRDSAATVVSAMGNPSGNGAGMRSGMVGVARTHNKEDADRARAENANDEIEAVHAECRHQLILYKLSIALIRGRPAGEVDNIDRTTIECGLLTTGTAWAEYHGCPSKLSRRLLRVAQIILPLRRALRACNWKALDAALARVGLGGVLTPDDVPASQSVGHSSSSSSAAAHLPPQSPFHAAHQPPPAGHMRWQQRLDRLRRIFGADVKLQQRPPPAADDDDDDDDTNVAQGQGQGRGEEGNRKRAVTFGGGKSGGGRAGGGPVTKRKTRKQKEADAQLSARARLVDRALKTAWEELQFVMNAVHARRLCEELELAIEAGGPRIVNGSLCTGTVDVRSLDQAVDIATELGCRTSRAQFLFQTARIARSVRHAIRRGDTDDIQRSLGAAAFAQLDEAIKPELTLAEATLSNRTAITELKGAILAGQGLRDMVSSLPTEKGSAAGGASGANGGTDGAAGGGGGGSGSGGHLMITRLSVRELDIGIARATELGCQTEEARTLLVVTKVLRAVKSSYDDAVLDAEGTQSGRPPPSTKRLTVRPILKQDRLRRRRLARERRAAAADAAADAVADDVSRGGLDSPPHVSRRGAAQGAEAKQGGREMKSEAGSVGGDGDQGETKQAGGSRSSTRSGSRWKGRRGGGDGDGDGGGSEAEAGPSTWHTWVARNASSYALDFHAISEMIVFLKNDRTLNFLNSVRPEIKNLLEVKAGSGVETETVEFDSFALPLRGSPFATGASGRKGAGGSRLRGASVWHGSGGRGGGSGGRSGGRGGDVDASGSKVREQLWKLWQ